MGKLTSLKPTVRALGPSLAYASDAPIQTTSARPRNAPWRAWYKTARWRDLRMEVLTLAMFRCARCKRLEGNTSKLVCNHVHPHRGNETKFWAGPFECVCKPCHDSEIQKEEQSSLHQRGVWN